MTPFGRNRPDTDLEVPILPAEALAHGLAALAFRRTPTPQDTWRAKQMVALLRKPQPGCAHGWTVVATPRPGPLAARAAALNLCLADLEVMPWHSGCGLALLGELRNLSYDLAPCAGGEV